MESTPPPADRWEGRTGSHGHGHKTLPRGIRLTDHDWERFAIASSANQRSRADMARILIVQFTEDYFAEHPEEAAAA